MKLKVGDKVYCKKDLVENINIWFYKCRFYEIINVTDSWVNIETDKVLGYQTKKLLATFIITKDPTSGVYGTQFEDYFYTPKELRKLKLDEIGKA